MAIKGLNPRLAEVGKIKIGGKGEERNGAKGKYRLPVRYNHFVVTTTEKGSDGNYIPNKELMKNINPNGQPKELKIRLPFDDIDTNFFTSYALYAGKKCACRGDGEKATRTSVKTGEVSQIKCDPKTCEFMESGKCKVSGILSCMLADNMDIGGIYRFRTHGWNSVSNILAALEYFSENTNGVLQGLPLKLVMLKKHTEEHGAVNTVTIVIDGLEMNQLRNEAMKEFRNRKMLGVDMKAIEKKAVSAGFLESTDAAEDIQEEWYPEVQPAPIIKGTSSSDIASELKIKVETIENVKVVEAVEEQNETINKEADIF